jgi:hypothetical protein
MRSLELASVVRKKRANAAVGWAKWHCDELSRVRNVAADFAHAVR